tara:strand:- start:3 stop:470 length:468 start_codon:yes stop_codon:yes gene_type:complete
MESSATPLRYFEDLSVGEKFQSRWYSVSQRELIDFSLEYDNQYFHVDPTRAKGSPFGGIIASGAYTFAVWNKLNLEINGNIAWIAGMGFENFTFPNPLRPEVNFKAESYLVQKRMSESDSRRGIVKHEYKVTTESGLTIFACLCPALVHTRDGLN